MRLAIADPPYLGRATLWYGGRGRNQMGRPRHPHRAHPRARTQLRGLGDRRFQQNTPPHPVRRRYPGAE